MCNKPVEINIVCSNLTTSKKQQTINNLTFHQCIFILQELINGNAHVLIKKKEIESIAFFSCYRKYTIYI